MLCFLYFCVFFFKQKTAYEMRISDWSSDVCSSDLIVLDDAKTTEQKRLELIAAAEVAETLFAEIVDQVEQQTGLVVVLAVDVAVARQHVQRRFGGPVDRKSTRLNSSH